MNATMIIKAINNIATKMYNAHQPSTNAILLLDAEEIGLVELTDVNVNQASWKVINGITEWCNNHL